MTYGCTDHGIFLFHTYWAQLLSKKPVLEEHYLKMASDRLLQLNYNTKTEWSDNSGDCDFTIEGDPVTGK